MIGLKLAFNMRNIIQVSNFEQNLPEKGIAN